MRLDDCWATAGSGQLTREAMTRRVELAKSEPVMVSSDVWLQPLVLLTLSCRQPDTEWMDGAGATVDCASVAPRTWDKRVEQSAREE